MEINKTRTDLAELFSLMGFKHIAEVGVEQGEYSEILCQQNPQAKIYCIDAWKAYKGYRDHTRQAKLNRFFEITKERLKPYRHQIIRKFSLEAVNLFSDNTLDAVYIDANHSFRAVLDDMTVWYRKIRSGGILSGHDYVRRKNQDQYYAVIPAVTEFLKQHPELDLIIFKGDSPASWMIIKK